MTPEKLFNCLFCKHLDQLNSCAGVFRCDAYPKGIPDKLIDKMIEEGFTHETPYTGDHGILFEEND